MSFNNFAEFVETSSNVLKNFSFINYDLTEFDVEDSVPWINIEANRVIKPQEALDILMKLQAAMTEPVLFNSLSGRRLRIVVNGFFHFTQEERDGFTFDAEYAHDFGDTIEEMKKEYEL